MKLNLERLNSIAVTLNAIRDIENAIKWYEDTSKAGPAYMQVRSPSNSTHDGIGFQLDRIDFLVIMEAQKAKLIKHLEERFDGFEYDPNAEWTGDKK